MLNYRVINCSIWQDDFYRDLSIEEKVIWSYLLTAPESNICGIYQIDLKYMSVNTGVPSEKIKNILDKFQENEKAFYFNNHIILINFLKHQSLNANQKTRVERILTGKLEILPLKVRNYIRTLKPFRMVLNDLEGFETLREWLGNDSEPLPNDSGMIPTKHKHKQNLNLKLNQKQKQERKEKKEEPDGSAAAASFASLEEQYDFLKAIKENNIAEKLILQMHAKYGIERLFIVYQHIYAREPDNWAGLFISLVKGGEKIPIEQETKEIAEFYDLKPEVGNG